MATKIRLQRQGKKKQPFYHIVIADSRAPRDGKYIEKIGYYDPIKIPHKINLDFEKALDWYSKGAQATNTVRNILRHEGVLLRYHLQIGVSKGALTQEQADVKFNDWKQSKDSKVSSKQSEFEQQNRSERKKQLESEKKTNEKRLEKIQEKNLAILKEREETARRAYAEQNPPTETKIREEVKEPPAEVEKDNLSEVVEEQVTEVVEEAAAEIIEEQSVEEVEEQPAEVVEKPVEEPAVEQPVAEEETTTIA
jgi:small subunit ribosomal protein S16